MAQFPRIYLLGNLVNKGRGEREARLLARQLPSGNEEGEVTHLELVRRLVERFGVGDTPQALPDLE
jgi:hypothetical protein